MFDAVSLQALALPAFYYFALWMYIMVFARWVKDMAGHLVRVWDDEEKMEASPELPGEISPLVESGTNGEEDKLRREHLVLVWANPKRHDKLLAAPVQACA